MSSRQWYKVSVQKSSKRVKYDTRGSGHASDSITERQLANETVSEASVKTTKLIGGNPSRDYHDRKWREVERMLDKL